MIAGVIFVALACFTGIPLVLTQTVGDTCPSPVCTATLETCNAAGKCECAANYINSGSQICISNDCTSSAAACNALTNFACVNNVCGCNAISSPVTADGATKGECAIKDCTANGNECGSDVTIQCSTGLKCECISTHTLSAGVCQAQNYGEVCSSDATCAGLSATDAVCDTQASSAVCKIAVGKTCSTTTDNCVSNGECDSTTSQCKCKANYVADTTGNLCTAQSSAGMIAASLGALLLTLLLQVSLV